MVIAKDLFEIDGPDLFADGDNHEAECWRKWTAHGAASALSNAFLAQSKCLHIQRRLEEIRNIFDDDLSSDIDATEGSAFDNVTWIAGFSWIDRECFVVRNIHVRS